MKKFRDKSRQSTPRDVRGGICTCIRADARRRTRNGLRVGAGRMFVASRGCCSETRDELDSAELANKLPQVLIIGVVWHFVDDCVGRSRVVHAVPVAFAREYDIQRQFEGIIYNRPNAIPIILGRSTRRRAEDSSRHGLVLTSISQTLNRSSMMKS